MTDPSLPEVARVASDLIRFDIQLRRRKREGEREAAEYVGAHLEALGLPVEYYEPVPRRTNVMARVRGRDASKPALVVHGHSTSYRRSPRTGASIRSPGSCATACCGAEARST